MEYIKIIFTAAIICLIIAIIF